MHRVAVRAASEAVPDDPALEVHRKEAVVAAHQRRGEPGEGLGHQDEVGAVAVRPLLVELYRTGGLLQQCQLSS